LLLCSMHKAYLLEKVPATVWALILYLAPTDLYERLICRYIFQSQILKWTFLKSMFFHWQYLPSSFDWITQRKLHGEDKCQGTLAGVRSKVASWICHVGAVIASFLARHPSSMEGVQMKWS
jgi:hypothetical protein